MNRKYYPLARAAEITGISVDDLLHMGAHGELPLYTVVPGWIAAPMRIEISQEGIKTGYPLRRPPLDTWKYHGLSRLDTAAIQTIERDGKVVLSAFAMPIEEYSKEGRPIHFEDIFFEKRGPAVGYECWCPEGSLPSFVVETTHVVVLAEDLEPLTPGRKEIPPFPRDGDQEDNNQSTQNDGIRTRSGIESEYVFKKEGNAWAIVFEGKMKPFENLDGLWYLHLLISSPDKCLPSTHLYLLAHKPLHSELGVEAKNEFARSATGREQPDGVIPRDTKTLKLLERTIEGKRSELEKAKEDHDVEQIENLTEEIDRLEREKTACRPKTKNHEHVRKAISLARVVIARELPDLEEHLGDALKQKKSSWCYSPRTPLTWQL